MLSSFLVPIAAILIFAVIARFVCRPQPNKVEDEDGRQWWQSIK